MWVYQEKQQPEMLPLSAGTVPADAIAESANSEQKPNGNVDAPETSPARSRSLPAAQVSVQPETSLEVHPPQKPAFPSRDCILLAVAYLFGTFLAGLAAARCSTGESEVFGYYLSCWQKLFSVGTAAEAAGLFRTELLTVAGALAVLLFLGLSALGPLPIFLFTILYGTGSGLLSLQWASGQELFRMLLLTAVCGIPSALAAGAVCTFGASALSVSGRLCASTFGRSGQAPGAGVLLGQFVRTLFLLLPLCGAAVGALYLVGQGKLL